MAGIAVLCPAQVQQSSPGCQAPSSERDLPLHRTPQPAAGVLTLLLPQGTPPSCHTGDFSSLMVTSCSDNCVWDCAAYLKITLVVNVLFLRWLIGLWEAGCTTAAVKVSQLPTHASPTPPPPRVPYLNSSNGQYGTCRDECETGHRVTELQSSLPPL